MFLDPHTLISGPPPSPDGRWGKAVSYQLSGPSHIKLSSLGSHSLADGVEVTAGVELCTPASTYDYVHLCLASITRDFDPSNSRADQTRSNEMNTQSRSISLVSIRSPSRVRIKPLICKKGLIVKGLTA